MGFRGAVGRGRQLWGSVERTARGFRGTVSTRSKDLEQLAGPASEEGPRTKAEIVARPRSQTRRSLEGQRGDPSHRKEECELT